MAIEPKFQAPDAGPQPADSLRPDIMHPGAGPTADIIQVDTALESMRDSGFDLTAAAGEPIDNSIEARATLIRVLTRYGAKKSSIDQIAFADNGSGIDPDKVAHVLSMGYSTRYNQRGSLGRFGVGLKLAGLSLGRRIDIYTRQEGDSAIWHAYLDLDEISGGTQKRIVAEQVSAWPAGYEEALTGPDGQPFPSGTLVLYSKIDRLASGGTYGTSLDQKLSDLRTFIARTYRKFLDQRLVIELNGTQVTLLDPLFLMDNPRVIKRYAPDVPRGTVVDEGDIMVNDHKVHVTVTLAPVEFRPEKGEGGLRDHKGKDIREFQIPDNERKITMLRNGREINYDMVARLLPGRRENLDRYIGVEVAFPAELDEFFQVRNVKRGAVPVDKLREELRKWLERPFLAARREIRRYWGEVETRKKAGEREHQDAEDAAARAERTAPKGAAGQEYTEEQAETKIGELLQDLGVQADQEEAAEIRQEIQAKPMKIIDGNWFGKEIFEITHLNGKAIVTLNHRHPFIRDIYDTLKAAGSGEEELTLEELTDLTREAKKGLDVLFLAYAKAENMHPHPEIYDDLRSYWGIHTQSYLRELPTEE